jgi:hypothetical protein
VAGFETVVSRRLHDDERLRQDAFRTEIATSWSPTSLRDRLLHYRGELVLLLTRLFGGGPTLLEIAVASTLIAIGMALRIVAPAPHNPAYSVPAPDWARAVVVAGMLTLAFQAYRSPRRIRSWRPIVLALAPIPVLQLWLLLVSPFPNWPHWPSSIAWTFAGVGVAFLVGGLRSHRRSVRGTVLVLTACGALAVAGSEIARTIVFARDGDTLLAAASAVTLAGAFLIAVGLIRSRVELPTRAHRAPRVRQRPKRPDHEAYRAA